MAAKDGIFTSHVFAIRSFQGETIVRILRPLLQSRPIAQFN